MSSALLKVGARKKLLDMQKWNMIVSLLSTLYYILFKGHKESNFDAITITCILISMESLRHAEIGYCC